MASSRALPFLVLVAALGPGTAACRSLPEPGAELAPPGADDPDELEDELEEGGVYTAELRLDARTGRWSPVRAVAAGVGESVRIDWVNLDDFPALSRGSRTRARVVFEAIASDVEPGAGGRRTVAWACRLLSVR